MNPQLDVDQQIEIIVQVCTKLADILTDPTDGGKVDITADQRKQAREDARDQLMTCIETLASLCNAMHGFYDVLSIGSKLGVKNEPTST